MVTTSRPLHTQNLLKRDLALAFRVLARHGHGFGLAGHITARLPGEDSFWVHYWGLGFDEVCVSDLVRADMDLNLLEGERAINVALHIHTRIYVANPHINTIIHSHPAATVAFGALGLPLKIYDQSSTLFEDNCANFNEYGGLVVDKAEGEALATALASKQVAILQNHGLLATGGNIAEAVIAAIQLERSCSLNLAILQSGQPGIEISPEVARLTRKQIYRPESFLNHWAYHSRRALATNPDVLQ